jgi:hypothetical protein
MHDRGTQPRQQNRSNNCKPCGSNHPNAIAALQLQTTHDKGAQLPQGNRATRQMQNIGAASETVKPVRKRSSCMLFTGSLLYILQCSKMLPAFPPHSMCVGAWSNPSIFIPMVLVLLPERLDFCFVVPISPSHHYLKLSNLYKQV